MKHVRLGLLFAAMSVAPVLALGSTELTPLTTLGVFVSWQYDSAIPIPGSGSESSFSWNLVITANISPRDLVGSKWNLKNTSTGQMLLNSWQDVPSDSRTSLSFKLAQDRALSTLLPTQENYQVVISTNSKDVDYFISIGGLCSQYPNRFMDSSYPNNQSCHADISKMPNVDKECIDYRKQLQSIFSCEDMKQEFRTIRICGEYNCN